jgi:hypothetical protein
MSSDFHGIDGSLAVLPVVNSVVIELVGLSGEVDAVLGEFMADLGKLAPVGGLPGSGYIFIRDDSNVDLLNGVFELIHEHISISLVDGLLLVLVDADEGESDSLDIEIVDHGVGEEVVGIENHGFDGGVVEGSVGVDGEVLILIPCVPNNETGGEIVSSIKIFDESGSWNEAVDDLGDEVNSGCSEQESAGFLKLDNDESLTEWDGGRGEGIGKIAIEPEEELLPDLPLGLNSLGGLESIEDLGSVSESIADGNRLATERKLLSDISEVAVLLVRFEGELSVEDVVECVVVIEGVSVDLEFHSLDHPFSWEVRIEDLVGNGFAGIQELSVRSNIAEVVELSHDLGFGIDGVQNRTV